jgi:flagellar biosynthesis protein FlhB
MAEDSDQEKTEEPTSKRLEDARKKGQIARSREFNTFAMLVTSAALLLMLGKQIGNGLLHIMQSHFQLTREAIFDPGSPIIYLRQAMIDGVLLIAPFVAVLVIVAIVAPLTLGGWVFSWEALTPKFSKLNPMKGIARMFAMHGLVELAKGLLKVALITTTAFVLAKHFLGDLTALGAEPLEQSIAHAVDMIGFSFMVLCASLILVVMVDVPYQLYDHSKKLKMTLQEIKDEMKESEGSPEVKARQRRTQMTMAQNRMMAEVPKADVIITNPSHFAVALKYDPNAGGAPRLVAKGVDLIAAQIRSLATGAEVPLVAAPPLARALYYSTELDKEIPQGLYLAVAQVLAYVFHLKTARENHWDEPLPPSNIKVPDEFKQGN